MKLYSQVAMERAMKVQEIILRAIAKKITWIQAAQIIGIAAQPAAPLSETPLRRLVRPPLR